MGPRSERSPGVRGQLKNAVCVAPPICALGVLLSRGGGRFSGLRAYRDHAVIPGRSVDQARLVAGLSPEREEEVQ